MPDRNVDETREALLAKANEAWRHDPALGPEALGGGAGDSVSCYLRAYYERLATEDLTLPSRMAAVAEAHARPGLRPPPGRALVQGREPGDPPLAPVRRPPPRPHIPTHHLPYLVD